MFVMLMSCAWLMENPDELPPREVPEHRSSVRRANQVDRKGAFPDPARGALTGKVPNEGTQERTIDYDAYNPVVVPITVDGPPAELKTASGKVIKVRSRKLSDAERKMTRKERQMMIQDTRGY